MLNAIRRTLSTTLVEGLSCNMWFMKISSKIKISMKFVVGSSPLNILESYTNPLKSNVAGFCATRSSESNVQKIAQQKAFVQIT